MRVWVVMSVLVAISGCSHSTVRCDGHLTPINAPAKAVGHSGSTNSIELKDAGEAKP
jgi:hypothetical protein